MISKQETAKESNALITLNMWYQWGDSASFQVFLWTLGVIVGNSGDLDIIILSEEWPDLNKSVDFLHGYNRVSTPKPLDRNDGVVVHIKSEYCADCKDIGRGVHWSDIFEQIASGN